MKLLKPKWVSHDGNPIFSLDLHPDESRFVTGGQGDGGCSGRIIVWNMSPVVNGDEERSEKIPKMLCVMDNHLACVNCVRWSCNGRYLASGGDDRLIMIWQFSGYGSAAAFGTNMKSSGLTGERWRCVHTLKGHDGDILDLAWSPGDQWLASCSIDNTVVIWNGEKFAEKVTVLKGHTSLVKGVTWDPVGTYLASQSDDRTVRVWRTLDWKQETIISEPFEECGATTHVLRLSWSPEGGYLVSAHAMNNCGPTAQIIERNGWLTNMDFVGHRKAITCTRFSGRMFRYHPSKHKEASKQYTVCAVGSRDRAVSIWLTSLKRPLVVIHDLFDDSVMDFSWSLSGLRLLCCSWDGTVAYMEFKPEEVGVALNSDEMNEFFKLTYGKASSIMSRPLIIENPAMLAMQKTKTEDNISTPFTPTKTTPIKYPTKQIETRTPTGRRRIIPIFVAPQEEIGGVPIPFGSAGGFGSSNLSITSSPSKAVRKISFDKKKESVMIKNGAGTSDKSTEEKQVSSSVHVGAEAVEVKKKGDSVEDKIKKALDNRLSEKTSAASSPVHADTVKSKLLTPSKTITTSTKDAKTHPSKDATTITVRKVDKQSSSTTQQKKVGRSSGLQVKRKADETDEKQQKRIRKEEKKAHKDAHKSTAVTPKHSVTKPVHTVTVGTVDHLPLRRLKRAVSVQIIQRGETAMVKAHNEVDACSIHRVVHSYEHDVTWEAALDSPVVALHFSTSIVCVACNDKSVRFLSAVSGRQIMPNCCVDSPVVDVHCYGHYALVVLSCAKVYSWDTKRKKAVLNSISFAHLLPTHKRSTARRISQQHSSNTTQLQHNHSDDSEGDNNAESPLKTCRLLRTGLPLITLSNDVSYTYNIDLATWTIVHSPSSSVHSCAKYLPSDADLPQDGILASLQKHSSGAGARALRMFNHSTANQKHSTMTLLEDRIQSCISLSSANEFKFWLLSYVRYLVDEGIEMKLREICDEFLGPSHIQNDNVPKNAIWQPYIMNILKRSFLCNEILPVIGSNLSFQRLYTEYQDQLDLD